MRFYPPWPFSGYAGYAAGRIYSFTVRHTVVDGLRGMDSQSYSRYLILHMRSTSLTVDDSLSPTTRTSIR